MADDPAMPRSDTVAKLQRPTPQQQWAMAAHGLNGHPGMDDPFAGLWPRVQRLTVSQARRDPRITLALCRAIAGPLPPTTDPGTRENCGWIQTEAQSRLARTAQPAESAITTGLVLLACPHPGCGRASFRDQHGT